MTKKEKSQQSKVPPKYIRVLKILSIFSLCLTMLLLGVVNGATYVVKTDIGQDILKKSKHCSSATHSYYYVALLRFIDYLYFCNIDN